MRSKLCVWATVVAFLWISTGKAQLTTGVISGTVTDATGAVLPGAKVVIQNEDTGISRTLTTDAAGRYTAPSLNLGNYKVTANLEGFQTEVRSGIVLTVGRQAIVNFELPVGAVTQTVEVTGEAPLVDTTKSSVDYLVADTTVRELPLNGRDLAQLILLNPGVAPTELPHGTQAYYGYGKLFSISGFKLEDNRFLLDGTDINQFDNRLPSGASGALFGTETVREFEVKTSTFSAQYGRALGGVMNAVSRSGTNTFHGGLFEFLRNSSLDARDFFDRKESPGDPRLPPFKRNQFGATAGGPMVRDKTFFFAGYEGLRERRAVTVVDDTLDENARRGILPPAFGGTVVISPNVAGYVALYPLPTGQNFGNGRAEFVYVDPQRKTEDFGQIRMDHQFSAGDSFFGRLTAQNGQFIQAEGFPPPDFKATGSMNSRFLTLSDTHVFSPTALLTLRAAFNRINPKDDYLYANWPPELFSVPNQPYPPLVYDLGGGPKPNSYLTTNKFEYVGDVNLTRNDHSIQFGASYEREQLNLRKAEREMGQWSFRTDADFLRGIPSAFRGTPLTHGDFVRGYRFHVVGMYVQDDWRVRPNLTFNLGLRWDFATPPTEVNGKLANLRHLLDPKVTVGEPLWENRSWRDFGPRFGFAWSPFTDGKTSVRGGFGILYQPITSEMIWSGSTRDGYFSPSYRQNNPSPALFPSALAVIADILARGVGGGTIYPWSFENLQTPSAYQWNVTLQRQMGNSMVVGLGYAGNRGLNATSFADFNTPQAEFVNGQLRVPAGATRNNPNFESISYNGTNMNSWYNALQLNVQRRMAAGVQFQVAYTWSKALNMTDSHLTASSLPGEGGIFYPHDPSVNKGLSGVDVPHLFTANYVYELPFGSGRRWFADRGVWSFLFGNWDLNGIVTLKSGQPFTLTTGIPSALSGLITERRPMAVPGVKPKILGVPGESNDPSGLERYFDPSAFSFPTDARSLGNLGRHTLRGPGVANWDLGLSKNFPITEQMQLKFRAEFFNVFNHPNFSNPSSTLFDANGVENKTAGRITTTVTKPREIQLGLKLAF